MVGLTCDRSGYNFVVREFYYDTHGCVGFVMGSDSLCGIDASKIHQCQPLKISFANLAENWPELIESPSPKLRAHL